MQREQHVQSHVMAMSTAIITCKQKGRQAWPGLSESWGGGCAEILTMGKSLDFVLRAVGSHGRVLG